MVKVIDVFPDGFVYDTLTYTSDKDNDYLMDGYEMLVWRNYAKI